MKVRLFSHTQIIYFQALAAIISFLEEYLLFILNQIYK